MQNVRISRPAGGPIGLSIPPDSELRGLRDRFDHDHHVLLPGLLGGEALARIHREIDQGSFTPFEHPDLHKELLLETGAAPALLLFLTNDPSLFQFVRRVTGCDRITWFNGRLCRMMPVPEHADSWHNDLVPARMVAMSINLGAAPHSGGILEIRDARTSEPLQQVANTGPGDAVLIRLARELEHRVTAVEGDRPRTVFAGWFQRGDDTPLTRPDQIPSSSHGHG